MIYQLQAFFFSFLEESSNRKKFLEEISIFILSFINSYVIVSVIVYRLGLGNEIDLENIFKGEKNEKTYQCAYCHHDACSGSCRLLRKG